MEIKEVYEFIKDFWKLIKSSYEVRDDDQYWSDLTQYAVLLEKKYSSHGLVKKLLLAYLDYQEETWRAINDTQSSA
jgi:hypothetical protein